MRDYSRYCSWCDHLNALPASGPAACAVCRHRADVRRECCDCELCARMDRGLTAEDLAEVAALLARRGRRAEGGAR